MKKYKKNEKKQTKNFSEKFWKRFFLGTWVVTRADFGDVPFDIASVKVVFTKTSGYENAIS